MLLRSIPARRLLPWFALAALFPVGPAGSGAPVGTPDEAPRVPVLIELFTSEGCSSCPSADEFLSQLRRVQPIRKARIIVLSEHVDYWNDLGWSDPYSRREFSRRQGDYALALGNERVYTPQMIVDGTEEFVGNDRAEAMRAITRSTRRDKSGVLLTQLPASPDRPHELTLEVSIPAPPAVVADVLLALAEDDLSSDVSRGENSGRVLHHDAVVRELRVIGRLKPDQPFRATPRVRLLPAWEADNLRAVAFIQQHKSRAVLGLAQLELASAPAEAAR